jgi:hypothetical protein
MTPNLTESIDAQEVKIASYTTLTGLSGDSGTNEE